MFWLIIFKKILKVGTEDILQELHKWSIEYKINHYALKSFNYSEENTYIKNST